jgi:hypothetical protein
MEGIFVAALVIGGIALLTQRWFWYSTLVEATAELSKPCTKALPSARRPQR